MCGGTYAYIYFLFNSHSLHRCGCNVSHSIDGISETVSKALKK